MPTKPDRPTWKFTGVTGLYLHTVSLRYYSRYSLNGRPMLRSLKTTELGVAKIKHAKVAGDVERARLRRTAPEGPSDVRTMADLKALFLLRLAGSQQQPGTKISMAVWVDRLEKHWPTPFATARPNHVDLDFILRLRAKLQGSRVVVGKKVRKGYAPAVVNQTLDALNLLLQLAKEKHLIFTSPFDDQTAFGGKIRLKRNSRKPDLPSRFDMERVFDSIARVKYPEWFDAKRIAFLQSQATDAAEHARFLAFSGARLNEANRIRWEDVGPETIQINGTKTAAAVRPVPIVDAMRVLLDEMRARRVVMGLPLRGPILRVKGCLDALRRACARIGIPLVRHHDLRHYFMTTCIESGVDIPTIARWVGHKDGGALLMRIYAHLRDAHTAAMGRQVSFAATAGARSALAT